MNLEGQRVSANFHGRLGTKPDIRVGDEIWEIWALSDVRATARAAGAKERDLGGLPLPFYVVRDPEGNPTRVRVSLKYDEVQRRLLETLVGAVRFPSRLSTQERWAQRERDNLGWHNADYHRTDTGVIERRKTQYEVATKNLAWSVVTSEWKGQVDGAGNLQLLTGTDSLLGKSEPLNVEYSLKLEASKAISPVQVDADAIQRIPNGYVEFEFGKSNQRSARERDEFIASGIDSKYVLVALAPGAAKKPSWQQIYTSAAYLRLHPESIQQVENAVTAEPPLLANAVMVIGEAGSEPAQALLVRWMRQLRAMDAEKSNAILEDALRRVTTPGPPLVDYLLEEAAAKASDTQRGFVDAAALAVAHSAERADPHVAQWTERLLDLSRGAAELKTRGQFLASLGRIKRPEVLAELLRSADAPELLVRSGAIAGLGTHGDLAGQARLVHIAAADKEPAMRIAAAQAMSFTGVKRYETELIRAYRNEKLETVRIELVRTLGRLVRTVPRMRELLKKAMAAESNAGVRAELQRAVEKT